MDTYKALYYPFIHFKDDSWLKLSALYWDSLCRIVPTEYTTKDSETVRALGGFVEDVAPGWAHPEFGESFAQFIAEHAAALRKNYAVELKDSWEPLPDEARGPGPDPRLSYVFYEKLVEDTFDAIHGSGLAEVEEGSQWVGMHPRLTWVYMTALAEQLSGERGLRPLTDETRDHFAASVLSTERMAHALLGDVRLVDSQPTATEIETAMVSIAYQAVVPSKIESVSIDKILEFREKYPNDRARFQKTISELLNAADWLETIQDRDVLEDRLRDQYEKLLAPQVAELKEKLGEVGIDTALGCFNLKMSLPATLAAGLAAAFTLPLNPVGAATAGLALSAIPMLRDKRKDARSALRASNVSYLYRMEEDLEPSDLRGWIQKTARSFALDV